MKGLQGCEFVNHAYLDFLGVDRQVDVANYDWAKFVHETDRDSYVTEYLTAVAKQEVFDARFRFRRADGEYRWMHSIGRPRFGSSGQLIGYVGASFDITHLLEAQGRGADNPMPN
jgi:PAS domain S-box-containing protein